MDFTNVAFKWGGDSKEPPEELWFDRVICYLSCGEEGMSGMHHAIDRTSSDVASSRLRIVASLMTDGGAGDHRATEEVAVVMTAWLAWVRKVLPTQCTDGSGDHGGFDDLNRGWCDGRHAAYTLGGLLAARSWRDRFNDFPGAMDATIERAVMFLLKRQRADGQLDLSGVYSPNEAGFPLPSLVEGYRRLRAKSDNLYDRVGSQLEWFIRRAAEAVLAGSAYTANHRWAAACAPLAAVHSLWPDDRWVAKINHYLADGIDCDADGCWHVERSTGYNMVANHGMIVMADHLNRPDFVDHVVRNLRYMLLQIQPNGEADASTSHRQDRGKAGCAPSNYAIARRAAMVTGDGQIATLAAHALQNGVGVADTMMPSLYELDRHPGPLPVLEPLPARYERTFPATASARWRRDDIAVTLAADSGGHFFDTVRDQWGGPKRSEDWIHVHAGDVVVQSVQLAGATMRCVQPSSLLPISSGRYRLSGHMPSWSHPLHFRPDSPVVEMPLNWRHDIDVTCDDDTVKLHIRSETPEALYGALKIWVRAGVTIETRSNAAAILDAGENIDMAGGDVVTLRSANHRLDIEGLPAAQHHVLLRTPESIPSVRAACGCLTLGLRFPVNIQLVFRHRREGEPPHLSV